MTVTQRVSIVASSTVPSGGETPHALVLIEGPAPTWLRRPGKYAVPPEPLPQKCWFNVSVDADGTNRLSWVGWSRADDGTSPCVPAAQQVGLEGLKDSWHTPAILRGEFVDGVRQIAVTYRRR